MRNLTILDLQENDLDRISGLDALENLRVLMLGKNRLRKLENLKRWLQRPSPPTMFRVLACMQLCVSTALFLAP